MRWTVYVAIAAVALLFVAIIVGTVREEHECEESGGHWVVDHYQTQVVMAGKTPIIQQIPVYGCHR